MGLQSLGLSLVSPPLWSSRMLQLSISSVSTEEALCASCKTRSAHTLTIVSSSIVSDRYNSLVSLSGPPAFRSLRRSLRKWSISWSVIGPLILLGCCSSAYGSAFRNLPVSGSNCLKKEMSIRASPRWRMSVKFQQFVQKPTSCRRGCVLPWVTATIGFFLHSQC